MRTFWFRWGVCSSTILVYRVSCIFQSVRTHVQAYRTDGVKLSRPTLAIWSNRTVGTWGDFRNSAHASALPSSHKCPDRTSETYTFVYSIQILYAFPGHIQLRLLRRLFGYVHRVFVQYTTSNQAVESRVSQWLTFFAVMSLNCIGKIYDNCSYNTIIARTCSTRENINTCKRLKYYRRVKKMRASIK